MYIGDELLGTPFIANGQFDWNSLQFNLSTTDTGVRLSSSELEDYSCGLDASGSASQSMFMNVTPAQTIMPFTEHYEEIPYQVQAGLGISTDSLFDAQTGSPMPQIPCIQNHIPVPEQDFSYAAQFSTTSPFGAPSQQSTPMWSPPCADLYYVQPGIATSQYVSNMQQFLDQSQNQIHTTAATPTACSIPVSTTPRARLQEAFAYETFHNHKAVRRPSSSDMQNSMLQNSLPAIRLDGSACTLTLDRGPPAGTRRLNSSMSLPTRKKPRLRPSLSDSHVMNTSSPARLRAASLCTSRLPRYENGITASPSSQQLPLPPLPPSMLISTPPRQVYASTPSTLPYSNSFFTNITTMPELSHVPQPTQVWASDIVPQSPLFPGDVYTPQFKRRNSSGRWEGYCHICQPGRWLDLKNSRYWEDKLRNHGICARTKVKFEEPVSIRYVTAKGVVVRMGDGEKLCCEDDGNCVQTSAFASEDDVQEADLIREGLCGKCGEWIAVEGVRIKVKDRPVGWWMHAYKCHNNEKARCSSLED